MHLRCLRYKSALILHHFLSRCKQKKYLYKRQNNNLSRHKNYKKMVDEKQFIFKKIHRSRFLSVLTCILYKTIGTGCEKYQSQWDITLISTRREHTHAHRPDYFKYIKGWFHNMFLNNQSQYQFLSFVNSYEISTENFIIISIKIPIRKLI